MAGLREALKAHLLADAALMAELAGGVHILEAPATVRPPYLVLVVASGAVTPISLVHVDAQTATVRCLIVLERSGPGLAKADPVVKLLVAALVRFRGLHGDLRVHEVDISFGGDTRGTDDYEFSVDAEIVFLGGET